MSFNTLSGPIPSSLFSCIGLIELKLAFNLLENSIPTSFASSLVYLQVFYLTRSDLEGNLLNGSIPYSLFNNASSLRYMYLGNNLLDGVLPESVLNNFTECSIFNENICTHSTSLTCFDVAKVSYCATTQSYTVYTATLTEPGILISTLADLNISSTTVASPHISEISTEYYTHSTDFLITSDSISSKLHASSTTKYSDITPSNQDSIVIKESGTLPETSVNPFTKIRSWETSTKSKVISSPGFSINSLDTRSSSLSKEPTPSSWSSELNTSLTISKANLTDSGTRIRALSSSTEGSSSTKLLESSMDSSSPLTSSLLSHHKKTIGLTLTAISTGVSSEGTHGLSSLSVPTSFPEAIKSSSSKSSSAVTASIILTTASESTTTADQKVETSSIHIIKPVSSADSSATYNKEPASLSSTEPTDQVFGTGSQTASYSSSVHISLARLSALIFENTPLYQAQTSKILPRTQEVTKVSSPTKFKMDSLTLSFTNLNAGQETPSLPETSLTERKKVRMTSLRSEIPGFTDITTKTTSKSSEWSVTHHETDATVTSTSLSSASLLLSKSKNVSTENRNERTSTGNAHETPLSSKESVLNIHESPAKLEALTSSEWPSAVVQVERTTLPASLSSKVTSENSLVSPESSSFQLFLTSHSHPEKLESKSTLTQDMTMPTASTKLYSVLAFTPTDVGSHSVETTKATLTVVTSISSSTTLPNYHSMLGTSSGETGHILTEIRPSTTSAYIQLDNSNAISLKASSTLEFVGPSPSSQSVRAQAGLERTLALQFPPQSSIPSTLSKTTAPALSSALTEPLLSSTISMLKEMYSEKSVLDLSKTSSFTREVISTFNVNEPSSEEAATVHASDVTTILMVNESSIRETSLSSSNETASVADIAETKVETEISTSIIYTTSEVMVTPYISRKEIPLSSESVSLPGTPTINKALNSIGSILKTTEITTKTAQNSKTVRALTSSGSKNKIGSTDKKETTTTTTSTSTPTFVVPSSLDISNSPSHGCFDGIADICKTNPDSTEVYICNSTSLSNATISNKYFLDSLKLIPLNFTDISVNVGGELTALLASGLVASGAETSIELKVKCEQGNPTSRSFRNSLYPKPSTQFLKRRNTGSSGLMALAFASNQSPFMAILQLDESGGLLYAACFNSNGPTKDIPAGMSLGGITISADKVKSDLSLFFTAPSPPTVFSPLIKASSQCFDGISSLCSKPGKSNITAQVRQSKS